MDDLTTETEYFPEPDRIVNVALGPQHPGAGHFRIRLWLDGDYVVRADPDPGYIHRGEEKMAEYRNYIQNVPPLSARSSSTAAASSCPSSWHDQPFCVRSCTLRPR